MRYLIPSLVLACTLVLQTADARKRGPGKRVDKYTGSLSVNQSKSAKAKKDRAQFTVDLSANCFPDVQAALKAVNILKNTILDIDKELKLSEGDENEVSSSAGLTKGDYTETFINAQGKTQTDPQCSNVAKAQVSVTFDTNAGETALGKAIDNVVAAAKEAKGEKKEGDRTKRLSIAYKPPTWYASEKSVNAIAKTLRAEILEGQEAQLKEAVASALGKGWQVVSVTDWNVNAPRPPQPQPGVALRSLGVETFDSGGSTQIHVGSGKVTVSRSVSVKFIPSKN